MKKSIILAVATCMLAVGCSQEPVQQTPVTIQSVSDFAYTMNDKSAVAISFGKSNKEFCELVIHRENVFTGYTVNSQHKNTKDISASCNWGGKQYVQSSKHQTSLQFKVDEVNQEQGAAKVNISLKLVQPYDDKYFELDNVILTLDPKQTSNLLLKI